MPKTIEYDMREVTTRIATDYLPHLDTLRTEGITTENAGLMRDALANFAADLIPFIADAQGKEADDVERLFVGLVTMDPEVEG